MKMLNLRVFPKFVTLSAGVLFACGMVFAAPKVTTVNCADANGKVLGYFTKKADGTWYEQGYGDRVIDNGKNYTQFNEDDWSYYLFDKSRGVAIQIDLYRKVVKYGEGPSAQAEINYREIYKVSSTQ